MKICNHSKLLVLSTIVSLLAFLPPKFSLAEDFGGFSEVTAGLGTNRTISEIILDTLLNILTFIGLIAVVTIIIAGIRLVISFGDENAKESAKRIIIYTLVGLIIIALASAIVRFVRDATLL